MVSYPLRNPRHMLDARGRRWNVPRPSKLVWPKLWGGSRSVSVPPRFRPPCRPARSSSTSIIINGAGVTPSRRGAARSPRGLPRAKARSRNPEARRQTTAPRATTRRSWSGATRRRSGSSWGLPTRSTREFGPGSPQSSAAAETRPREGNLSARSGSPWPRSQRTPARFSSRRMAP